MGWERDEWRSAVGEMSEVDRQLAYDEPRRMRGLCGDQSDAAGDCSLGAGDGDESA